MGKHVNFVLLLLHFIKEMYRKQIFFPEVLYSGTLKIKNTQSAKQLLFTKTCFIGLIDLNSVKVSFKLLCL